MLTVSGGGDQKLDKFNTSQMFLSGLQNDQILGKYGDTHLLTENLLIALIEDTEKYHRNLGPQLNVVLKSTLSWKLP